MLKMSSNTVNVRQNLKSILDKLSSIYSESPEVSRAVKIPRLVAVSKTKPKEMIVEAYEAGQRHFGENYVQEMADKAADSLLLEKCPDIKWHFIGTVQSNKVAKIVKSPNLTVVETVASQKLADKFQSSCKSNNVSNLGIMIQVQFDKLFCCNFICYVFVNLKKSSFSLSFRLTHLEKKIRAELNLLKS